MANWDDLRVFLAVARSESLSSAGKLLKLDPATVGRRISRLEEALETPLFAKSPQGYELTRDGQRLMNHAESAERAVNLGTEDLQRDTEDGLSGTIRVGAPDGCANYVLPMAVAKIVKEHPALEIQIIAQPRLFSLSKREVDLAVTVSQPSSGRLLVQKITDYHLSIAAMQSYIDASPEVTHLEGLSDHKVVGYVSDLIFDKELDYLAEIGLSSADYSSNSVSVQLNMIRAGFGLGVVHDFCLPYVPGLTRVMADQFRLQRSYYLVRHADDRKVARLSQFAELLVREMRGVVTDLERQA